MRATSTAGIYLASLALAAISGAAWSASVTPTGVIVTSVTAGLIDPNGKVPVFDGVPDSGIGNFDIPTPYAILQHGFAYMYTMSSQNTTFNGTCKNTYKLTQIQGGVPVTLDSGVFVKSYDCAPSSQWGWAKAGKVIPNSPGPATLTGTVQYGTSKVSMSVHILIQ